MPSLHIWDRQRTRRHLACRDLVPPHARTQVLFSSSIMYGNYITIGQKRILARLDEENRDRIQVRPRARERACAVRCL